MPALPVSEFEAATAEFVHLNTISLQLSTTRPRLGNTEPGFARGVKKVHIPRLSAVCYLADKRHLYAGIDTGELRLWDFSVGSRKQAWLLIGSHKGSITSVLAVSSGSRINAAAGLVLTGSADASIKVWDIKLRVQETHVCVQSLVGHTGTVTGLVHRGACILSSSTDCTIRIWKAAEGRGMLAYPWFEPLMVLTKMTEWVTCMSYAASAKVGDFGTLYAADAAAAIVKVNPCIVDGPNIWKESSQIQWKLTGSCKDKQLNTNLAFHRVHDRTISAIRYLPEEGLVATIAFDNTLRIFNALQSTLRCTVTNDTGGPFVAMEHDTGRSQLLLIDKHHLHVWDLVRDRFVARKRISQQPLIAIFKTHSKGEFGVVSGCAVDMWRIEQDLNYRIVLGGHTGPVIAVHPVNGALGVNGSQDFRVFSAGQDDTVRVWDPFNMTCICMLKNSGSEITALTCYATGNMPITGHDNGGIKLWNLETADAVELKQHTNSVTCLIMASVSGTDELLFSAGFDGSVCVWDVSLNANNEPHLLHAWQAHPGTEILAMVHDAMKNVIVTAGNDNLIKVWNARLYEQVGQHKGHTGPVTCLALDGNFLISGSEDCTLRLWDLVPASRSGEASLAGGPAAPFQGKTALKVLQGHKAPLRGLVVLPEAGHVASISGNGKLLLWDYSLGIVLRRFSHAEEYSCLSYREDADEVIVGTMQNSILRFPLGQHTADKYG